MPKPRIVISLTTIPQRLHQLEPTLQSLASQSRIADRIYLNLPYRYRQRPLGEINELPPFLSKFAHLSVTRCVDHGPATKLLPTLENEKDYDTLIVTADDDVFYPRDWLKTLVQYSRKLPGAAIAFSGRQLSQNAHTAAYWGSRLLTCDQLRRPIPVDVLMGTWGCLYKRCFFNTSLFRLESYPHAHLCDDLWFSGSLAQQKIPRYVIPFPQAMSYTHLRDAEPLYPLSQRNSYPDETIRFFQAAFWPSDDPSAPAWWPLWKRRMLNYWYFRWGALSALRRIQALLPPRSLTPRAAQAKALA